MRINKRIVLIILIVILIIILLNFGIVWANKGKKVNILKTIEGRSIDRVTFTKMSQFSLGEWGKNGITYRADIAELKAVVQFNKNTNESLIIVKWRNKYRNISVKGFVTAVYWRPKTTGFLYTKEEEAEGDEGDFGICTINYVKLELKNEITVSKIVYGIPQTETHIAWSSSGKYYVYSACYSLGIRNFESGQTWETEEINLDGGKIKILPDTPTQLGYFSWLKNDTKIMLLWKNHPNNDEPDGYAVVDVSQLGLK